MNYELAKELKDAGFPQNSDNPQIHTAICGNFDNPDPACRSENRGVAPTLEELIEACGDGFYELIRVESDEWYATTFDSSFSKEKGHAISSVGLCSTPTEAVARLFIALNKSA